MPAHVPAFSGRSMLLLALLARLLWRYRVLTHSEEEFCPLPTPPRRALDALPPEIWSAIFDYHHDDVPSINAIRMVCRAWTHAAWPAFAKSFDYRMFHPTVKSLRALQAFANRSDCAPYMTCLNMSTVRPQYDAGESRHTLTDREIDALPPPDDLQSSWTHPRRALWNYSIRSGVFKRLQPKRVMHLQLRQALRKLVWLEEIRVMDVSASAGYRPSFTNVMGGALWNAFPPDMRGEPYNLQAQAITLSLLFNAMRPPHDGRTDYVRNLTKLNVEGRMYIGSLPDNTLPSPHSPSCSPIWTLTHLDLSLTTSKPPLEPHDQPAFFDRRLPSLLTQLPNLTHLALHFPTPRLANDYNEAGAVIGTHLDYTYGSDSFRILSASLRLPRLQTLHFSHLGVSSAYPLMELLYRHSPTLRHLSFLSLSMSVWHWRSFTNFLAEHLCLETLAMDSDASEERRAESRELWGRVPAEYHFSWKDFRRAAKRARWGTLESGGEGAAGSGGKGAGSG